MIFNQPGYFNSYFSESAACRRFNGMPAAPSFSGAEKNKRKNPYGEVDVPLPRDEAILKRTKKALSEMKYAVFAVCLLHFILLKRAHVRKQINSELDKQLRVYMGITGRKVI